MFGCGWESGGVLAPPAVPRRAVTDALVTRMAVTPNASRIVMIDHLVGMLIDAGI